MGGVKVQGKTHVAIGMATGSLYSMLTHQTPFSALLITITASISAKAPDWDTANEGSTYIVNPLGSLLFHGLQNKIKHRTLTHSIVGLLVWLSTFLLVAVLVYSYYPNTLLLLIFKNFLIGNALGYTSHLLADMLTNRGVPLFYPVGDRIKAPLTLRYNSPVEGLLIFLSVGITIWSLSEVIWR
jgi:inner membrane protein